MSLLLSAEKWKNHFSLNIFSGFLQIEEVHWRCSIKKGILKKFAKFTGKCLCQSLFFNEVAGLRPATFI